MRAAFVLLTFWQWLLDVAYRIESDRHPLHPHKGTATAAGKCPKSKLGMQRCSYLLRLTTFRVGHHQASHSHYSTSTSNCDSDQPSSVDVEARKSRQMEPRAVLAQLLAHHGAVVKGGHNEAVALMESLMAWKRDDWQAPAPISTQGQGDLQSSNEKSP